MDMTELKGKYAVALDFSLADLTNMARDAGANVPPTPAAADPGGSSSFVRAVQALG